MGDGERGSSKLITIHIYCQQNLMEWSFYLSIIHTLTINCQNHSEWMQRSLNRKSVGIIQFIKKYNISSIKKQQIKM